MVFQSAHIDFASRNDPKDLRRGDGIKHITSVSDEAPGFVIAGYPDDEGIRNNGGRPGATKGPNAIREFLYRMVKGPRDSLYDVGNLKIGGVLSERHDRARQVARSALQAGHRWIGLGGGHDYGFADGAAFLDMQSGSEKRPLIINFDAHLDVRPPTGEINSGTPFFRLSEHAQAYDMVQVGIQAQCNSLQHVEWSRGKGHTLLTLDDYWSSHVSLEEFFINSTDDLLLRERPTFISVDIDAFAWPYSIGSSQSWPTGLEPKEFWPLFELLLKRMDVRMLGIYETSPPLDVGGGGTARLAALIADTFLRKAGK
jgi:formiminoglutamase